MSEIYGKPNNHRQALTDRNVGCEIVRRSFKSKNGVRSSEMYICCVLEEGCLSTLS